MERKLLRPESIEIIVALKQGYREDEKNYFGLEAFLYFWRRENKAFENPLDYLKPDCGARTLLKEAYMDLMHHIDNPTRLTQLFFYGLDQYEKFNDWNFSLTEVEKVADSTTYALAYALRNCQIRDNDDNGELVFINGFSEASWNAAIEYVGIAIDEEDE